MREHHVGQRHQLRVACSLCPVPAARFAEDQVFTEIIETQIKAVYLVDGDWYVRLDGDLAGRVTGAVYDASQGDDTLLPIPVSVSATSQDACCAAPSQQQMPCTAVLHACPCRIHIMSAQGCAV
jgi:hypothetical protein